MDEEDKNDIINKINTSGNIDSTDDSSSDENTPPEDNNSGSEDLDIPDFSEDMNESEMDSLFIDPKRNMLFQPGNEIKETFSNIMQNILKEDFGNAKKNDSFVGKENFMTETEPAPTRIAPSIDEPSRITRREKPWRTAPTETPNPTPKALEEDDSIPMDFKPKGKKPEAEVYHGSYSSAVTAALENIENQGFNYSKEEVWDKISTGPAKPKEGVTNKFTLTLFKKDSEGNLVSQRKAAHIQIYGMGARYELNTYLF